MAATVISVSKKEETGSKANLTPAKEGKKEVEEQFLLESEPTFGDGNCAFNAFALGLAEGVLADKIVCPSNFYTRIASILSPKTTNAENFKEWLHNHTPLEWQQTLQAILRKIAVGSIKEGYGSLYDYHAMLVSARDNPSQDDTFRCHEVIQKKMEEVRVKRDKEKQALAGTLSLFTEFPEVASASLDETQKEEIIKNCKEKLANVDKRYDEKLCTWFDVTGKKIFFETLEQSALGASDRARWGSDVELAALARYFGINIRWKKGSVGPAEGRIIGVESGRIPELSDKEKRELRDLGIGDREGDFFKIQVLHENSFLSEIDSTVSEALSVYVKEQSEVELPDTLRGEKVTKEARERLNQLGLLKDNKILLYKNIPCEITDKKDKLNKAIVEFIEKVRQEKSRQVPSEIAAEHRRWLKDRSVITTTGELEGSNNCPDKYAILKKLGKIPEALKGKVQEHFRSSPVIFEVGNSGSHWTYYRVTTKTKQGLETAALKQFADFIQQLEKSEKENIELILNKMKEILISGGDINTLKQKIQKSDLDKNEKKKVLELSMSGTDILYDPIQGKKFLNNPLAFIKETQLALFLERNKASLVTVNLDKNNNLFNYFKDMPVERLEKFCNQFKQAQQTMPIPIVIPKEPDNKWHVMAFSHFLKLQFVPDKAVKVDCQFEKINLDALKKEFLDIKQGLIEKNKVKENSEKDAGVLFVRYLGNTLTIFYYGIEFFDKKDKNQTNGKMSKEKSKRCVLKIFSSSFSEDRESTLRGNWKNLVSNIKSKEASEKESLDILEALAAEDFLQASDDGMTRFDCYTIPKTTQYSHTGLLYKTLKALKLEQEEVDWSNKEASTSLHEKYKNIAQQSLIKDLSVAKIQQGFCYQEYLMMLIAYLATITSSAKDFSIIAEAAVPEAWNDMVLEWNGELIFFQQKHRSSHSTSVAKMYPTSEILAKKQAKKSANKKKDVSLLKYYTAYKELIKRIEDPADFLHRYQDKLRDNKIKFIFFTNRTLPLEAAAKEPEKFTLKKIKINNNSKEIDFIELGVVARPKIPLIDLTGIQEIIDSRSVYQITSCNAERLADCVKADELKNEQDSLNKFLASFYLFAGQMGADELFLHCRKIIKAPPGGGFGQAFLADTFAHYIHQAFVAENLTNSVLNRTVVNNFLLNHENYHYNLVKYSCYNYPEKQLRQRLTEHPSSLSELECLKNIRDSGDRNISVYCAEPFVGLAIIQSLFPPGERQVLTLFSPNLSDYIVDSRFKYIIIVGEESELDSVIKKIAESPTIRIIRIRAIEKSSSRESTLQVKEKELRSLHKVCSSISVLGNIDICLTDLLLFGVSELTGGLSEQDIEKYVQHTSTEEEVVLPYDKLETEIKIWVSKHKVEVDSSWFPVENSERYECRIHIALPETLHGKKVNHPSNRKFVLDTENKCIYYIHKEAIWKPIKFSTEEPLSKTINFLSLETAIEKWSKEKLRFAADIPKVQQCFDVELSQLYDGALPNDTHWDITKNKKSILYFPFGKSQKYSINWSDIPLSGSTITVIEAEAACGKTWFLRKKINQAVLGPGGKVPLFIRLKDLEKVKDIKKLIPEMLAYASLSPHIIRIAERSPQRFHLLLDGFDELLKGFLSYFEQFLNQLIQQGYSVTVTVRDYQLEKLQKQASHIIIQQRLNQFDDKQIKDCLRKALKDKIAVEDKALDEEIERLHSALKAQTSVNEWLGIPLHIALLSEWYLCNRKNLISPDMNSSISEIYNFIIQHRIKRNSKMNPADFYKFLYIIAVNQVSDKNKFPLILPLRRYNFKEEVRFDLGRTGLLKNPFSEEPEFFHRTFAEFFIAKKFSRKIIKNPENCEFNLKLTQFLYQTENRLICHFFIELLKVHHTDSNISYELTDAQQKEFSNNWLIDLSGQDLSDRKEKAITFQDREFSAEAEDDSEDNEEPQLKKSNVKINTVKDLLRPGFWNGVVSSHLLLLITKWIENNTLTLDKLLDIIEGSGEVGVMKLHHRIIYFNIIGLYFKVKNDEYTNKTILDISAHNASSYIYGNKDILNWWRFDDVLTLIERHHNIPNFDEIRSSLLNCFDDSKQFNNNRLASSRNNILEDLDFLKPREMNKVKYRQYFMICFAIYKNTTNKKIKDDLYRFIRNLNINVFAHYFYPKDENFIFEQCKTVDEFNIDAIKKVFILLKQTSKPYRQYHLLEDMSVTTNSHVLWRCEPELDRDYDFARPVLKCVGPHLNIIHVFYLNRYAQDDNYVYRHLIRIVISNIKNIDNETDLRSVFSSVLVFLCLVEEWESTMPIALATSLVTAFERLLNSPEINPQANLFIRILFINFMLYFDLRGYMLQPSKEESELSTLALIASNGYNAKLKIRCNASLLFEYRQIALCFFRIKYYEFEKDRLQYFFNIWEECGKNKLQFVPQLLLSLGADSHAPTYPITNSSPSEKTVSLKQGTKRNVGMLTNEALSISSTPTDNDALVTVGDNSSKRTKLTINKDATSNSSGYESAERETPDERAGSISFPGDNGAAKGKVLLLSSDARGLGYDSNNTVDVSGLGNNCGLFALTLAIKLRLKKTPNVKISENSRRCFDEINESSLRMSIDGTKRAGKALRAELNKALITSHDYKNKRYQSFLNHLKKILKNESPDIDMEAFIVPNRDYSEQLQKKWQLRIKELEEAYECSEKKYRDHLHVPINLDNVAQLTAELSRLALQSTDSKTIEELLNRYKDKRLNLTDQYVDLMRLFNTCWLSIDREKGSPEERGRLSEIIKMRFVKIASEALKSEASVNSFLMLSFASETQFGDDGSLKTIVEKREIYSRVITFFADINLQENWEMVYKNYCDYISSKDVMLTADELGCLASYWKVQLTIHFNSESSYRSYLKPDNRLIQVTLSNRSQNHWQVQTTEFFLMKSVVLQAR
jgi:hypothetical protein